MKKYGFDLLEERDMKETGGRARLWKHGKTGAEVLSICNDDENKCFGASFYTPPEDSTGVAHILEHSVLCGSEKYLVKEPFVELLKGSLQTFLNAFTFPDKTCYPVASANLRDFYNLVDVYLDAVFHPVISENIFRQEGWHIESESPDSPWSYKGVVFNEMKGVYSQADSMLAEKSQQAVFPDNLYSLDSGGNPEKIPELTYEKFRNFHKSHYNPSNARFFFWGDDPEEERLKIIADAIGDAERRQTEPFVPLQKPFKQPRRVTEYYPAQPDEKRALFTMNWLLPERGNVLEALKMEMLEHILEGLPGSPLRRAMMESGLAEDTTGSGLETDLRQMYYSTGLKGILPENIEKAEQLILDTLAGLVKNGIPAEAVESALNSVEFAYRENNSGRFPRGLAAMIQSLSTWLYGEDPLAALAWEKPLDEIKKAVASGEKVFEKAIEENFLNNPHRVAVTLLPDASLAGKRQRREDAILEELAAKSTPEEKRRVAEETEILKTLQLAPDRPEDLAKIPSLRIDDLNKRETPIPSDVSAGEQTYLEHELPTNGIAYATMLFPVRRIPEHLLPLMPLFSRSLLEWGTEKRDYSELGMLIAARTGGIGANPLPVVNVNGKLPSLYFSLQGKAVASRVDDLFTLFEEILLEPQKDQQVMAQRLYQMTLEERARLEYGLQAAGHAAVLSRIKSRFRPEQALMEKFSGITQLEFLKGLEKRLKEEPDKVLAEFLQLRDIILAANGAIFDVTGDRKLMEKSKKAAEKVFSRLPKKGAQNSGLEIASMEALAGLPKGEAFITQGQVNYVGKGANLSELGIRHNGTAQVISRWLRMGPIWENVRVAGGAYGGFCALDKTGGTWTYASYRDPNVLETLQTYDRMGSILREFSPTDAQLAQAIIGAVGDLDTYLLPDAKGSKALGWHLTGETMEQRQQRRDEMLSTTARDFHEFADALDAVAENGAVSVLGGAKAAQAAREKGWPAKEL